MQFVYKPEGAEALTWDFNPNRLMSPEVEAIERHTGLAFGEWVGQLEKGSFAAIHGLLYVLLKRKTPTLKWDDIQFCLEDVGWNLDAEDLQALVKELEAKAERGPLTELEADQLHSARKELEGLEPGPLEDTEQ